MPRLPGLPKTGGRQRGTPNKRNPAKQVTAELLGVDPFEILLLFAKGECRALGLAFEIDPTLRLRAAMEACHYLYPKMKATEESDLPTDAGAVLNFTTTWKELPRLSDEQIIAKAKEITLRGKTGG